LIEMTSTGSDGAQIASAKATTVQIVVDDLSGPSANTRLHAGPLLGIVNTMSAVPERWSQATIYPDMWVDSDEDPRTSDGVSPDGELATLQDYLRHYRLTLQMKCDGLDPEKLARRSVPPSTMSLLGLLRHLAEVERDWRNWILPEDPAPKLYGTGDADFEGAVAEQALVEGAFADLAREQAATDAVLAEYPDLGARVGKENLAVRELWVHRVEEYARHCGHADLLRERIDGRVGQ
jgi:uncharacterized damage-inducible protein DinB